MSGEIMLDRLRNKYTRGIFEATETDKKIIKIR